MYLALFFDDCSKFLLVQNAILTLILLKELQHSLDALVDFSHGDLGCGKCMLLVILLYKNRTDISLTK